MVAWWRQGIQGTTIHAALVRQHGFRGSYSSVRRFLSTLEAAEPRVTTVLSFEPGEAGNRIHGTTREQPLRLFTETEQNFLSPLPTRAP